MRRSSFNKELATKEPSRVLAAMTYFLKRYSSTLSQCFVTVVAKSCEALPKQ